MRSRIIGCLACMAAAAALGTALLAQTNGAKDRFTFTAATAKSLATGQDRLELVVNHWADEAERSRMVSVLAESGPDKLGEALWGSPEAGYIHWPGNLEYIVRYAQRTPRPDGGEDVVLATASPMHMWWEPTPAASTSSRLTVIELRLAKDGKGEGKLSFGTGLSANKTAKTITLEDYTKPPVALAEVRREGTTS